MRRDFIALSCVSLMSLLLVGCMHSNCLKRMPVGPARAAVERAVGAMGGVNAWCSAGSVEATAVVAIRRQGGQSQIERMHVTMDFGAGLISATGQSAQGEWSAKAGRDGTYSVNGPATMSKDDLGKLLVTILYRTSGPLDLMMFPTAKPPVHTVDRVGGVDVERLDVETPVGPMGYYFDISTGLLRFLTAGDAGPGGKGTVTVYGGPKAYAELPNKLLLPKHFSVHSPAQRVMLDGEVLLDVELSDIK